MVCTVINLLTIPINVGCALISIGCTAITGVMTTVNGAIVVVQLSLLAAEGVWQLTKITYHGTRKIVEISFIPLSVAAQLFAMLNRRKLLDQESIAIVTQEGEIQDSSIDEAVDDWLRDAVKITKGVNKDLSMLFTTATAQLYSVEKKEEYEILDCREDAIAMIQELKGNLTESQTFLQVLPRKKVEQRET